MRLGIDVGGTHTDAVLISEEGIVAKAKVPTRHDDLLRSIESALSEIFSGTDRTDIEAINLSTTLTTNALLEGKTEPVGVIVSAGPGIDPAYHAIGGNYFVIDGSIDHRGVERKPLDEDRLSHVVAECRERNINAYAVVSKFSVRNPAHEKRIAEVIGDEAECITLGHRLSGGLNFPRRITTAYYNAAVWHRYWSFADAVERSIGELGIRTRINVLKADGGTMSLLASRSKPVESILSGPAASVMGIAALREISSDAVLLDIGGTSTDIALFAAGSPLVEQEGITLHGRPTLVRALKTSSIAVGGDSAVRINAGRITVGPDREGPALAVGGSMPALTDAMNFAGESSFGDVAASRRGIEELAKQGGMTAETLAQGAIGIAIETIRTAVERMIRTVNERPAYTIQEVLHPKWILPVKLFIVGGPADAFASRMEAALGMTAEVPRCHGVANAIGAALTRTTMDIEIFADTERGMLVVPRASVSERIFARFGIEEATKGAQRYLAKTLAESGEAIPASEIQTVEASCFNMVQGSRMVGQNIRVRSQVRPGLVPKYLEASRLTC